MQEWVTWVVIERPFQPIAGTTLLNFSINFRVGCNFIYFPKVGDPFLSATNNIALAAAKSQTNGEPGQPVAVYNPAVAREFRGVSGTIHDAFNWLRNAYTKV